jgi:hypothetical protein
MIMVPHDLKIEGNNRNLREVEHWNFNHQAIEGAEYKALGKPSQEHSYSVKVGSFRFLIP